MYKMYVLFLNSPVHISNTHRLNMSKCQMLIFQVQWMSILGPNYPGLQDRPWPSSVHVPVLCQQPEGPGRVCVFRPLSLGLYQPPPPPMITVTNQLGSSLRVNPTIKTTLGTEDWYWAIQSIVSPMSANFWFVSLAVICLPTLNSM